MTFNRLLRLQDERAARSPPERPYYFAGRAAPPLAGHDDDKIEVRNIQKRGNSNRCTREQFVSHRPQEGVSSFDLASYIEETVRIERRLRAVRYAKLVLVVAAPLLLMDAPDNRGFAYSLALKSSAPATATAKPQSSENWTRLAFAGGRFH